jgi:transposase
MVLIRFQDRFDHMGNHTLDPKAGGVRRIEVITGAGRRRRWTREAKARIVAESYSSGLAISEVARRHEIRAQQLFGWRHQARTGRLVVHEDVVASFVPVIADMSGGGAPSASAATNNSVIEIELAGAIVRVHGEVSASALIEVLTAVKRAG